MTSSTRTQSAGGILHVLLMDVQSERYDQILRDTSSSLQRLSSKVEGLLRVDLYGTDDRTDLLLVSQWEDEHAWGRAQWDDDVQNFIVAQFTSARRVHSKLYRHIDFGDESPPAAPRPATG